ncbi:MAG: GNAT family N-acetyltransferase [Lachnospiraceae bacterium]|nr:GNAT family N-acetyltransferase [Lachnospiraceae bacterium]
MKKKEEQIDGQMSLLDLLNIPENIEKSYTSKTITAFPFAVYEDSMVVGFIMMGYYEAKNYYTLWKLMIDSRYQNRGYGRKALEFGIQYLRERFSISEVYTGVVLGNTVAKKLYEAIGFRKTGLAESGMEEMRLIL